MKQLCKKGLSLLLVALLLTAMLPLSALAAEGTVTIITAHSGDGQVDPGGKVVLKEKVSGSYGSTTATPELETTSDGKGTFTIESSKLTPGTDYEIWVNGFKYQGAGSTPPTVSTETTDSINVPLYKIQLATMPVDAGENKVYVQLGEEGDEFTSTATFVYVPEGADTRHEEGTHIIFKADVASGWSLMTKDKEHPGSEKSWTAKGGQVNGDDEDKYIGTGTNPNDNPYTAELHGTSEDGIVTAHFLKDWTVTAKVEGSTAGSTAKFTVRDGDGATITNPEQTTATVNEGYGALLEVTFTAGKGEKLTHWGVKNGRLYEGESTNSKGALEGKTQISDPGSCELLTVYFAPTADNAEVTAYVGLDIPDATTITYDWNYTEAAPKTVPHTGVPGTTDSAPPTAPTREGYTFDGWYTEATCENKAPDPIVFPPAGEGPVTYYARWTPAAPTEYAVTVRLYVDNAP